MIKINLEDTYEPILINDDITEFKFNSELRSGEIIDLYVRFEKINDPFLPDVYNLAFGPIDSNNVIDDSIKMNHVNLNKLFSTIILFSITFLDHYQEVSVGIDGSNDSRAYLYHRMFESNQEELKEILITIGVDWYVRLLRNGNVEVDHDGVPFFKPKPEPFDLTRKASDLYRYYLIALK